MIGGRMRKQYLNPKEIFQSPFFTHTVGVSGPAKIVYVSGQVSYDRDGFVIGKDDMRAQAEQVFKCLTHNLKAAGATWSDVVKLNGYMVKMNADAVNLYREVRALPRREAHAGKHADRRQAPGARRPAARGGGDRGRGRERRAEKGEKEEALI